MVEGHAERKQFFSMGSFQMVGVPSFLSSSAVAGGRGLASRSEDCGFVQRGAWREAVSLAGPHPLPRKKLLPRAGLVPE